MTTEKKEKTTRSNKNKKLSKADLSDKIKNYYQRWNINIDQHQIFNDFKQRTLDSLVTADDINVRSIIKNNDVKKEYLRIIGELPEDAHTWDDPFKDYHQERVFQLLYNQKDFIKYIFYLQAIFWLDTLKASEKEAIYDQFQSDIANSQVQVRLIKTDRDFLFYPAGAQLLDTKLINEMLVWIVKYPDVYENFKNALEKYNQKIYKRNLVDNLRLALELLLQNILKNRKTLENQKQELGQYFKDKGIVPEIRNLYMTSMDYYSKYQNNYVKHHDNVKETEIEFILYLTGTFIRFLLVTESLQSHQTSP